MSPDYLRVNPRHKVPALAIDNLVLLENAAIMAYLAKAYPKANLKPQDAIEEAKLVLDHDVAGGHAPPVLHPDLPRRQVQRRQGRA